MTAILILHATAGLLPSAFMVAVGTGLQRLVHPGSGEWGRAPVWLTVAVGAFVLQQVLAPVQLAVSQVIARRVDARCVTRFTTFAMTGTPLRALETPAVADRLSDADRAFEEVTLTPGAATEGALALTARYAQLIGAVAAAWTCVGGRAAMVAACVALMTRRGHSAAFHRWGRRFRGLAPLRRRVMYLRALGTGTAAAKEIRTLGLVDWIDERYVMENRAALEPLWRWRRRIYGPPFLLYAVLGLAGTASALLLLARVPATPAQLARLTIGAQALAVCARFGVMFPESDVKMVYGRSAWQALLEFEQMARAASADAATPAGRRVAERPITPRHAIRFERVSFGYDPARPVLADLDMTLPVGSSTALVGVNGAGKTTLVKLLTGLYVPDRGRVTVDGSDLRELDIERWRHSFAVTFQDFVRYELSLRENVAMAAIEHRDDDAGLIAQLTRVGLGDLLAELPFGLDTPLTRAVPDGVELSGGQWQRVALARALFAVHHGASMLVLDEPTAALDARGEVDFYDMFLELTRGVTSLVISHRFSSVRRADRIVVLDGGRVSECGTHAELVAAGGQYARLFTVQARRFAPVGADGGARDAAPSGDVRPDVFGADGARA